MSKLLIVDDEIDIREFARRFFQKRGIEVETAEDGNKALDLIQTFQPDVVMLDIRMEQTNGVDTLKQIRSENNPVKVIMVSGIEDDEVVNECKLLGVSDFIHKPLVLEELQQVVMKELGV